MSDNLASGATSYERAMFFIAGVFNWLVVLAFTVTGPLAWKLLGIPAPAETLFVHLFLVFAAIFGLAYFWIAIDISGKNALILIAVIGKLAVFGVVVGHCLAGSIPVSVVLPASGDVVFAILFLWVWNRHREQSSASP